MLYRWILRLTSRWLLGSILIVTLLLFIGQLVKLRRWLWPITPEVLEVLPDLFGAGAIVLLEASLPLMSLLAVGIGYTQLKQREIDLAWFSLGLHPLKLLAPALLIGLLSTIGSAWIAQSYSPTALRHMGSLLERLALTQWTEPRGVIKLGEGSWARVVDEKGVKVIWAWVSDEQLIVRGELESAQEAQEAQETQGAQGAQGAQEAQEAQVYLKNVTVWSPSLFAQVKRFSLELDHKPLRRALKMFGAPNALSSQLLNPEDPHHLFTWHKRWSLPLSALAWAIFGALLGLSGSSGRALCVGAGLIAISYGGLRTLELMARAHEFSAVWAAWTPTLSLLGGAVLAVIIWLKKGV